MGVYYLFTIADQMPSIHTVIIGGYYMHLGIFKLFSLFGSLYKQTYTLVYESECRAWEIETCILKSTVTHSPFSH